MVVGGGGWWWVLWCGRCDFNRTQLALDGAVGMGVLGRPVRQVERMEAVEDTADLKGESYPDVKPALVTATTLEAPISTRSAWAPGSA